MSSTTSPEFTREYIRDWILRKLGYPTLKVELTDDQIYDSINDAIDEVAPWVVLPQFVTVPVDEVIDLSQYGVNAAYVINVHKTDVGYRSDQDNSLDVFNPMSYYNVLGNRSVIYNSIERILYDRSNKTIKDNISFRYIKPKLYLDIGYPSSSGCVVEYSPTITDLSVFQDDKEDSRMYQKYIKGFSLAYARKILAEVRGKYQVDGSPVTLDAEAQASRADEELSHLREELKDTVSVQFIMD